MLCCLKKETTQLLVVQHTPHDSNHSKICCFAGIGYQDEALQQNFAKLVEQQRAEQSQRVKGFTLYTFTQCSPVDALLPQY